MGFSRRAGVSRFGYQLDTILFLTSFTIKKDIVAKWVFNKRTIKVCVSCSWQCLGTSAPSTPNLAVTLNLRSSASNARGKSRVQDGQGSCWEEWKREVFPRQGAIDLAPPGKSIIFCKKETEKYLFSGQTWGISQISQLLLDAVANLFEVCDLIKGNFLFNFYRPLHATLYVVVQVLKSFRDHPEPTWDVGPEHPPQVLSLSQLCSVYFSLSRISVVRKYVFFANIQSRFSLVFDGALQLPCKVKHTWWCPCISVVPEATHVTRLRGLGGPSAQGLWKWSCWDV